MRLLRVFLPAVLLALTACSDGGRYADIDAFVAEKRAAPSGAIAPIPAMQAYRAFTYTASGLRSPFSKPVDVKEIARLEASSSVKPDTDREREFLESYSIDSLRMVGTVELNKVLWALLKTPDGGVHRVRQNNYVGRNHGKIVQVGGNYISVVEIVSTGGDGWVERPRSLELSDGK
ncbi:pilus assembly protein PilP [Spongiibacter sp.]|uniref:pilus assembly protein PilP n=1 Tax=Spongiibacter sp. TaxID=2024860 RepID=UPI0035622A00